MKNYSVIEGKRWKIGEATIDSIVEEEVLYTNVVREKVFPAADISEAELEWLVPDFATEDFKLKFVTQSYLIRYKGKNILVDTGKNVEGPYLENLKSAGCIPEEIDGVLFTHLHLDHVGRNTKMGPNGTLVPTFPNATYYFGREQYEHYKNLFENPEARKNDPLGESQVWPYTLHMKSLVEMGKVELIDDDFSLLDIITLYPVPGHANGQYAIVVKSNGDSAFIGADVAHGPLQMVQTNVCASFDIDPATSVQTREEVFGNLSGTDTMYLGMHFAGNHGGFIVKNGKGYKLAATYNTQ